MRGGKTSLCSSRDQSCSYRLPFWHEFEKNRKRMGNIVGPAWGYSWNRACDLPLFYPSLPFQRRWD
jgi:hypothetical protein